MNNEEIRRAFGARLKLLRKQKKWTQKELANKINIQYPQLNKYEGGLHTPSLEVILKLAEALSTSVDYLIAGNENEDIPLHNLRLLQRFKKLESFDNQDLEITLNVLDALILKHQAKEAVQG
jgi:transcriptional regulator with XRE-family HTH domain